MKMAKAVTLVEMGMRYGLQNEKTVVSATARIEFAQLLMASGVRRLELGAFVSPKWVPQMAGTADVVAGVMGLNPKFKKKNDFSVLVPNEQGMIDAIASGVKEVAIFTAASESFAQKNINCSIEESFARFEPVMALAKKHGIKVRGYLSTCFGCPFEGPVSEAVVVKLAHRLYKMGCYEVSIGDTIGVANAGQVKSVFTKLKKRIPTKKLAGHFHDTRGQALANILMAYNLGVSVFDTSVGGLGGCPYAPGATGNVATEDVVYMFHGMGVKTGLKLDKLLVANRFIEKQVQHELPSKVGNARFFTNPKTGKTI